MSQENFQELPIKELLSAGVHFGHQTQKWNPKMKPFVYGEKNGVYIIDLAKTISQAKRAFDFLKKITSEGRSVLFVATKRQAKDVVEKYAKECNAFFVTNRWLGGMLTNYKTIALSVDKLRKVEKMKETGDFNLLTKKERSKIEKEIAKLEKNLGGIREMRKLPGAIFIIDPGLEKIAVKEANTLGIPVIAITDTNCDPSGIDYVVPGNDDALKSISIFTEYFAQAVLSGQSISKSKQLTDSDKNEFRDLSLEHEIVEKLAKDIDLQEEEEELEVSEEIRE